MQREDLNEAAVTGLAGSLGPLLGPGDVLLLEGDLGAGKTTFTRALAASMRVDRPHQVRSPTFNICMIHPGPVPLVHVDLYRLGEDGSAGAQAASFEALGLGQLEQLAEPGGVAGIRGGVLVIEWAELWAAAPATALRIQLTRAPAQEFRSLRAAGAGRGRDLLYAWERATARVEEP